MKNIFLIFLITALSLTLSLLSGALNWVNQFVVCGIVYLLAGMLYNEKLKISRLLYGIIVMLPFLAIYSFMGLLHQLVHVYPIAFLPLVSLFTGLGINSMFAKNKSGLRRNIYFSVSVLIILMLGYLGMPNWLAYAFGNDLPSKFPVPSILLTDSSGQTHDLSKHKGKTLVLDIWSTGCGICIKEFPEFEKLKQTYAAQPEIECYAVHLIQRNEELSSAVKRTDDFPYTFKHLFTDQNSANQIRQQLQIVAVPTNVIIDKNGDVVYIGDLNSKKYLFVNNIHDIIEAALETD